MTAELPVTPSNEGNKDSSTENERGNQEAVRASPSEGIKAVTFERIGQIPSHQTSPMKSATKDHEKSTPSIPPTDKDPHKKSDSQSSKDGSSVDKSITISKVMFQPLTQTFRDYIQGSNSDNDKTLLEEGEDKAEEKLNAYESNGGRTD